MGQRCKHSLGVQRGHVAGRKARRSRNHLLGSAVEEAQCPANLTKLGEVLMGFPEWKEIALPDEAPK
jgi:hypothetical protein